MASLSRRLLPLSLAAAMVAVPIIACSASGDGANISEDPQPDPTTQLPGSDGSTTPETSTPKDGSTNDAGKDSGPPPPNPGDPCPVENAKFTKPCGKCGTSTALCLDKKVTDYGVCEAEMGVCIPGEMAECGKCGKQTCTNYCLWSACGGEKTGASACYANQYDLDSAGCGASTWRTRTCKADCTYNSYSTTCYANPTADNGGESPEWKLAAPGTVGQISSVVVPLRATYAGDRFTSSICPITSSPTVGAYPLAYITVTNPTGQTATATAWADPASYTGIAPRVIMGWYATTTRPTTTEERKACTKGMATSCPAGLSPDCTGTTKAGLTGTNALVIPPGGGVTLFVGAYDAGAVGSGDVRIKVRTDVLN